jgi:hypothetical protein
MGYFRELPELRYPSFLPEKNSSLDYVEVKNLFRRIKVRDDLQNIVTVFDKYEIPEGARPDNVAEDLYGSDELDWVVLITANIINVRDQWPLSSNELYEFALEKYGGDLNGTRFYETKEIKDSNNRLVIPKGKIVDSNYSITFYDSGLSTNVTKSGTSARTGISNFIYETRLNDDKKNIYVLKPGYLQQFLNDFRDSMIYEDSSEYIDDYIIQTENTNITLP